MSYLTIYSLPASRSLVLTFVLASQLLTGCGSNPTMPKHPDNVPDDQGVAFGRVRVFRGDSDVTGSCYLQFEDEKEELTGTYNLERDGWVFAALPKQRNYLYLVRCAVMFGLFHGTRDLYFDVPDTGKATSMGDIEFHLQNDEIDSVPGVTGSPTLQGGLVDVASLQGVSVIQGDGEATFVRNKLDEAVREYETRYGERPQVAAPAGSPAK